MTELLYYSTQKGNWLMECEAQVLEATEESVLLNQTVLHAQGGGQPSDCGSIFHGDKEFIVSKVTLNRETGIVTHWGDFKGLANGVDVRVKVNEKDRLLKAECHSAGHVVDAVMAKVKGFRPIKGYHFLEGPYVEYDGCIAVDERPQVLSALQEAFDAVVEQDIATEIQLLDKGEADAICNRVARNFDMEQMADDNDQVRVVTVGGSSSPCGGTHVRSTAELKNWKITGFKCKKSVVRVKYSKQ